MLQAIRNDYAENEYGVSLNLFCAKSCFQSKEQKSLFEAILKKISKVTFWIGNFTKRQILQQKFHNMSDFKLEEPQRL